MYNKYYIYIYIYNIYIYIYPKRNYLLNEYFIIISKSNSKINILIGILEKFFLEEILLYIEQTLKRMDKRVNINFKVSCTTNYGDTVFIVGNYQELGGWKPEKSIPLKTGGHIYPKWESPLLIFNMGNKYSGNLEYKYIIKTSVQFTSKEIYREEISNGRTN